ncbi:hypothetical protein Leryth_009848 [Lithospermum erythrorhizon]|nr:hypothetical protein Leryth_009848 [Lithospermum erythrorhizon]
MRMLFFQLSDLSYPYKLYALASPISEKEHEQIWHVMLHEALESAQFLIDVFYGFFLGQLPIKIRELKQSVSRIYIYAACCNQEASTFRDCLNSSHSSTEPIESYLLKLLNTLGTHYSGAWSDNELTILRQLAFMEAVLLSPQSGNTLSRMSDESEAPIYLWDDIEAAIFIALDAMIGLASSWTYPEEPVNTAVRFISLAIYNLVRIRGKKVEKGSKSEETVEPFWHRILGCRVPPKLSWIDEIGVEFWDCILNSMLNILQQSSTLLVQWKDQNKILLKQLRFLKYFLACPPKEFTRKEKWNDLSTTIKVMISRLATSLFISCYFDKFSEMADNNMRETISLVNLFEREAFSHRPRTDDEFGSLDYLLEKIEFLSNHSMIDSFPVLKKLHFEKALEDLTYLNASINRISEGKKEYEKLIDICRQIENVTCAMGYIVHLLLDGSSPSSHLTSWFSDLEEETKRIKEKVNVISKKNTISIQDHNAARSFNDKASLMNDHVIDEETIGFKDDEIKVLEQVVRGSEERWK